MRIAMIGSKGMPATMGGIERHVEEISRRLATVGFRVTVYTRSWYTGYAPWSVRSMDGVRIVALPSIRTKHLDAISHTFLATLHAMRARVDVYHFHGVGPSLLAFLPRLFRPRARVISTFHCIDQRHEKWGMFARAVLAVGEWASCRFPHETFTISPMLAAYCRDRWGRETTCTSNGVTVQERVPDAEAYDALRAYGLSPQRYLLVVSRFVLHKEVHTTIAAFRQLRQERVEFHDCTLAIVGGSAFTDRYADELRVHAGGDPNIVFLGPLHGRALRALYEHCLAFVHASRSEGLPLVVLEAAASGAIPVVSDIPEHRALADRIGGMQFRVGDVWDLVTKLSVLAQCAPAAREAMGARLRSAVAHAYAWEETASIIAQRYRACDGRVSRRSSQRIRTALAW